jgi:hypothetical protein
MAMILPRLRDQAGETMMIMITRREGTVHACAQSAILENADCRKDFDPAN